MMKLTIWKPKLWLKASKNRNSGSQHDLSTYAYTYTLAILPLVQTQLFLSIEFSSRGPRPLSDKQ